MDSIAIGIIGIISLLLLLAIGVHVAIALSIVGLLGMAFLIGPQAAIYTSATLAFDRFGNYSLVIIPLYVLMGMLAQEGGLSSISYETLRLWAGRLRAGLAISTVGACTMFGTMCGSSLVTAAVFAKLSAPEMRRMGYEKKFAYGVCSSAGIIGMLIPPSILIVYYGIITQESIGILLVAGISPGILLCILFSLCILLMVQLNPSIASKSRLEEMPTWAQRLRSLKQLWIVFLVFFIIFGGIYGGIFSPSEAGAVACISLLVTYFVSSQKKSFRGIKSAIFGTISTSSMIFLIFIGAGLFTRFLVLSKIAPNFFEAIASMNLSPLVFLVFVSVVYLILGCFLDSISMLSITLPILHPAALSLNIDPLHFAIVVIVAVETGLITPPIGLNIYAVLGVAEADVSLENLFVGVFPFFITLLFCLALFILFPLLSTWLPGTMAQ